MELEQIISIVGVALSAIFCLTTIIARYSKDSKARKNAEATADVASSLLGLLDGVKMCMIDTEQNEHFTAEEKHNYCKTLVIDYCIKNEIDYTKFNLDTMITYFMEICNLINAKPEKKQELTAEEITLLGD